MRVKILLTAMFGLLLLASGCSIKHPIAADYSTYLSNNEGSANLPTTALETEYQLDSATANHRYEFRAATVGAAHLWIVEFGKILQETLDSRDVQAAFGKLAPASGSGETTGNLLTFSLNNYEFKDFQAYVTLTITLDRNGQEVFRNTYNSTGASQGGKMFWGGPFAMKNAIQQSTKLAIDDILTQFINEINDKGLTAS